MLGQWWLWLLSPNTQQTREPCVLARVLLLNEWRGFARDQQTNLCLLCATKLGTLHTQTNGQEFGGPRRRRPISYQCCVGERLLRQLRPW